MGTFARTMQAPDYPIGLTRRRASEAPRRDREDDWAAAVTTEWLGRVGPDILRDPAALRWYTSYLARGASPAANRAIRLMNAEIDVRDVLRRSACRPSSSTARTSTSATRRGSWASASPAREWSSCRATTTCRGRAIERRVLDEIERFSRRRRTTRSSRTASSPRCSSPTSSTRRPGRRVGDRAWADYSRGTTGSYGPKLARFRGREVDTPATGSSRRSTVPPAPSAARRRSSPPSARLGIEVRAGVHTGEIERSDGRRPRHRGPHRRRGSPRRPDRARCSCRARSRTSSPARASSSRSAASASWPESPAPGVCSRPRRDRRFPPITLLNAANGAPASVCRSGRSVRDRQLSIWLPYNVEFGGTTTRNPRTRSKSRLLSSGNAVSVSKSGRCDPQVVGAGNVASTIEFRPQLGMDARDRLRDRHRLEPCEDMLDERPAPIATGAGGSVHAVQQLADGDDADRALLGADETLECRTKLVSLHSISRSVSIRTARNSPVAQSIHGSRARPRRNPRRRAAPLQAAHENDPARAAAPSEA